MDPRTWLLKLCLQASIAVTGPSMWLLVFGTQASAAVLLQATCSHFIEGSAIIDLNAQGWVVVQDSI